mmetsp:Transcript_48480/g.67370  ORF Transcript_48480/g.67370 Transcript_48480/m.67370 type:complete len:317 (-) Transcript_48480:2-952(-)
MLSDSASFQDAACGAHVPPTWTPCHHCAVDPWTEGEHVGQPLQDSDGVTRCHVVDVDPSTAEYASVVLPLIQHGVTIVEVQRVQNHRLYSRYHAKEMAEALMPWDTSVKDLWHGTTASNIDQLLLEGLDQRVAARGHFGRGLYFSDHPGKAHRYTTKRSFPGRGPSAEGIRTMLRCRVQLGKVKEYPRGVNDTSLLREPSGFDSVQGNISGQNEMVVYDNDRVLIEYVVRYTVASGPAATKSATVADIARELKLLTGSCCHSSHSHAHCSGGGFRAAAATTATTGHVVVGPGPRAKRKHSDTDSEEGEDKRLKPEE